MHRRSRPVSLEKQVWRIDNHCSFYLRVQTSIFLLLVPRRMPDRSAVRGRSVAMAGRTMDDVLENMTKTGLIDLVRH